MLFKNISVLNCNIGDKPLTLSVELEKAFSKLKKDSIGDLEVVSSGWVSPNNTDRLVHLSNGILMFRLAIEKRSIPKSFLDKAVVERAKKFEIENGFAPGRVARKKLKEDVTDELLPRAFPITKYVNVIVDTKAKLMLIDTSTSSIYDEVVKHILKCTNLLPIESVTFKNPLSGTFYEWIADGAPSGFTYDDSLKLTTTNGKVTYKDTQLLTDELYRQVSIGSHVSALAMTFEVSDEDQIHFVIDSNAVFRSVKGSESLGRQFTSNPDDFNANLLLATGAMSELVQVVFSELGTVKFTDELV